MSYATLPAHHVYLAAQITMQQITESMKARNEALLAARRAEDRALQIVNDADLLRGREVSKVMMLAVAATSVSMEAAMALDEEALVLIQTAFFDPTVLQASRNARAFAAMPAGNA